MGKYDVAPTPAAGLIRLARSKGGLTQAELASQAGISQQVVSAYETGRRDPTYSMLEKLIAAAGYEMRIRLEPKERNDESLELYLQTLPAHIRVELQRSRAKRAEEARLRRIRGG